MHQEQTQQNASKVYADPKYLKTDNAANLYTCGRNKDWSRTFRVSLTLKEEVDPAILKIAAKETAKRMPSLCLKLGDGFFWNYLERTNQEPLVVEESDYPYRSIRLFDTDDCAFRVLYYRKRISFEVFHGITDGNGTLMFLKTMTARYIELKHGVIGYDDQTFNVNDVPTEAEGSDDYIVYADKNANAKKFTQMNTYTYPDKTDYNYAQVTHGLIPVDDMKTVAKAKGLSVTEYISALHIFVAYLYSNCVPSAPIRVSIPMNLRTRFDSVTLRNFVYMNDISFDPKGRTDCSFDEICESIRGIIKQKATAQALKDEFSSNVASSQSKILSIIPYAIKRPVMMSNYKKVLHSYTMYFSNLGVVEFPKEIEPFVDRAEFLLGTTPYCPYSCACATHNGLINIAITSTEKNSTREKTFFRFLAAQGMRVRVESNVNYKNSIGGQA